MEQNLSTSLNMSQRLDTQLVQLVDIITMPTEELNEKIKKEAERNPVLDIKEKTPSFEALENKTYTPRTRMSDEANGSEYADDSSSDWFEKTVSEKEDLREHLTKELGLLDLDEKTRETAEMIISSLDQSGFTGFDVEALVPEKYKDYVKDAVKAIQSLEPTGVGAKDWREALMLQIKEIEKDRSEVSRYHDIIYRGLDYIKNGEEDKLARAMKIGREDLDEMIRVIRTLTPFPGLKYTSSYTQYIVPEITVTVKDGTIILDTHSSDLLDVDVDESYLALKNEVKEKCGRKDKEAIKFLRENIQSAENLIKEINMRKSTMEKLGLLLVDKERDFFLYGPMYLKPLTMTNAAEIMGVNVSTVSKLAQAKYVLTPWGTFPLRFFFSTEVKTSESDSPISKTAVIYKIKEIIENNTGGKKLSDERIREELEKQGIIVARRTVNKYRREAEKK